MAWTGPRTWVDGELVTAAIMNPHVRDNLLAVGPHLIARKTGDESVTSSAVLQNDDHLLMAVAANEVWRVEFALRWSAHIDGGLAIAFTFPTGGEIDATCTFFDAANINVFRWTGTTSGALPEGSDYLDPQTSGVNYFSIIDGIYVNAGTAGNLQLQFAQGLSHATPTILRANSTLWAVKLA